MSSRLGTINPTLESRATVSVAAWCRAVRSRELEMTAKTVQRDINFMRDELNLPLACDEQRHGSFYETPVGGFPLLQLSRRQLVTLFLARQALATVRGTRLEQELAQTFERLTAGLSDEVSFSWSELDAAFSVRATGVVEADARLFGQLSDSILQGREIAFTYRKHLSWGRWAEALDPQELRDRVRDEAAAVAGR